MAKTNAVIEISLIDGVTKGLGTINKGLASISGSLAKAGSAAIAAGAAFATFKAGQAFAGGIESAATFEQSLDKISAKTGVTGDALQALGADIRQIAQDASKTGADGAAAFERLTAEGANATEALAQLPTALAFATASSQATAEAVGSLSDNLDAFGLGADQFGRAADVITAGALKAGTGVGDLQKALQSVGPTARDLGLSIEQTTAALGTLAQNGLEGGKAGKALAAVFDQLRDPSSKFREELAKIGITSKDFNVVLAQLGRGGKSTEAALNALGLNGTAAVKALTKDGGAALAQFTAALGNVEGQTSKTAAVINQGLLASFTRLKESADAALSAFLQPILGPLSDEISAAAKAINEFAASPGFEDLRTKFRDAFVEGLAAIKQFLAGFDFTAAQKSFGDFVTSTGQGLKAIKESAGQIGAAVRLAGDGVSIFFNTLKTIVSGAVLVVTRSLNSMLGAFDAIASRTEGFRRILGDIGDAAEGQAAQGLTKLEASARDAGAQIDVIAGNTDAATAALEKAVPVLQVISDDALRVAENTRVLADAQAAAVASSNDFAKAQDAAATSLGNFGDAAKLAAENAAITADISSKSAASFKEIQQGIAADIAARKRQSGAIRDVAAATDEAAQAQADYQAAVAADAGYSDAVFAALGAKLDDIAPKIARLAQVSEASIRQGVNRDTLASIDGFVGMNDSLDRLQAKFELMGGDRALARIEAEAKRAAEAIANIDQAATDARSNLATLADELRAANQARGETETQAEQRRFQEQLAMIDELAARAGGTARLEAAIARDEARRNHEARLAEIAAEARARVDSELGADQQIAAARAGTSSAQGGGGPAGQVTPGAGNPLAPGPSIIINVQALTGRQAIEEAARSLADPLNRIARNSQ